MSDHEGSGTAIAAVLDRFLSGRLAFEALMQHLSVALRGRPDKAALRDALQARVDANRLSVSLATKIYKTAEIPPAAAPAPRGPAGHPSADDGDRPATVRLEGAMVETLVDKFRGLREGAAPVAASERALDQDLQSFLSLRLRQQARRAGAASGQMRPVDTSEPGIGTILRDRFVIDSELGRGGMGIVYRAVDRRRLDTGARQPYVALKILNADFGTHPDALRALETETRRAQELPHPCIVTVYDFDRDGGRAFIVMEVLEGTSLDRVLRQQPDFIGSPLARSVIDSITDALAFAHAHGVVHADLKPANVFLCNDGRTKLLDFGISAALQTGDGKDFDPTTLSAVTPAYASPQRDNGAPAFPDDDVYALGCMAHLLMTGKHPFGRRSGLQARDDGLVPPPLPMLSPNEEAAVHAALAFDNRERPIDAGAFKDAFRP